MKGNWMMGFIRNKPVLKYRRLVQVYVHSHLKSFNFAAVHWPWKQMSAALFKADMKRYIPLETAAIFILAKLFLKQGISSEYVMVDFICMGLLDMWGAQTENYKMKNSRPKWDSNLGPSVYEANALSVELLKLINIDHLKETAFYLSFLCKLPVPRGPCNNNLSCTFLI